MQSSHRVVTARCKRHGARMKQRPPLPNTPQHPQPPSWRLAGPAGQRFSHALNLVPSVHTQPQTEQTRQPCDRSHTPKICVPWAKSTTGSVVKASGPVPWHGVGRGPWQRVHQPSRSRIRKGAPWHDTTPQPVMLRDLVDTLDRYAAQKRKDCVSGDVLRVGAARARSPQDTRRRRKRTAVEGDASGPSACRWVVRSPKRHVPGNFDVWERRGWGEWRSSDHALSSNRSPISGIPRDNGPPFVAAAPVHASVCVASTGL